MSSRNKNAKRNAYTGRELRAGGFDKTTAIRVVQVPIASAGVYTFGEEVTKANRVHMEWIPSAILEGKKRRFFLSKAGIADPSAILTDGGVQMPRKGWSGDLEDRRGLAFGAGKLKIWVAAERAQQTSSVGASPLPNALLQLTDSRVESSLSAGVTPSSTRKPTK